MTRLTDAIAELEKEFGEGTIMTLDQKPASIPSLSTGSLAIDRALGIGGVPRGRITEVWGPEGAGKSTLALHLCAECQKAGETALYVDMEHALDRTYAEVLGVDIHNLLISQPSTGTEALKIVKKMIGAAGLIVVDSVPGLITPAEMDSEPGDAHVGVLARLMSQNLKAIIPLLGLSDTALVFVNQIRERIGLMFGNPETQPGGRALKFWASVRMEIRQSGLVGTKADRQGQLCKVKVVKNKCAAPYQEAEVTLIYGQGFSKWPDIVNLGVEAGILTKRGSYYYYQDESIAQGQKNAEEWVQQHPEIEEAVRAWLFSAAENEEGA